jgi:putative intracellular protease/amidase
VVDGRLITGQNPASGTQVGEAILEAFKKLG